MCIEPSDGKPLQNYTTYCCKQLQTSQSLNSNRLNPITNHDEGSRCPVYHGEPSFTNDDNGELISRRAECNTQESDFLPPPTFLDRPLLRGYIGQIQPRQSGVGTSLTLLQRQPQRSNSAMIYTSVCTTIKGSLNHAEDHCEL